MKKCPNCEKTFDDNMKFCQSDGTPLVEVQETPVEPEDPYKTTVARVDDLPIPPASDSPPTPDPTPQPDPTPPSDPFKTMVADSSDRVAEKPSIEADEKEEFDPMKTVVSSDMPEMKRPEPKVEEVVQKSEPEIEAKDTSPPTPFGNASAESEKATAEYRATEAEKVEGVEEDSITPAPEPPKFTEPNLSPPNFADSSGQFPKPPPEPIAETSPPVVETPPPTPVVETPPPTPVAETPPPAPVAKENTPAESNESEPFEAKDETPPTPQPVAPPTSENIAPPTSDGSEFKEQKNAPIPSPFNPSMPSGYSPPQAPMPSYKSDDEKANPFEMPLGQKEKQQMEQSGWTPPAMPDANPQNQELGQNKPFPSTDNQSKDKIMAFVSLGLGILGFICVIPTLLITLCGVAPFLLGLGSIITGFLARSRAKSQPEKYEGAGLGLAGIILGVLDIIAPIAIVAVYFLIFASLGGFR